MNIHGREIPISEIPGKAIRRLFRYPLSLYEDYRSVFYLMKNQRLKRTSNSVIRVAFLVQMAEVWDKEEPVYESLKKNSKFEVKLIVIPPFNRILNSVEKVYNNNYFLKRYPEAIPAYFQGKWIDLKDKFDYFFYQRPYDSYLPKKYQSRNLVKYAKCCYIPYGFCGSDNFDETLTGKNFFRNIYFAFLESGYYSNLLNRKFESTKKLHNFENIGYPALSPYFSIASSKTYKRILWTPRWSYDSLIGGSHFIEYKETINQLATIYPDITLTFRPHPLLFEELVVKDLMSDSEIEDYFHKIAQLNIKYDKGEPIFETFENTDILITDYSSIIIQFFITGRPIIYCESINIPLNETYLKLAEGMYVAKSDKDILKFMNELQHGNDYLFDKRKEIIRTCLKQHMNATMNIVKRIEEDFISRISK